MRNTLIRVLVLLGLALPASAQQPTIPPKAPLSRTDSIAQARADSVALMKELEKLARTPATTAATTTPTGGAQGVANPRMLPDFSAVGDLLADLSPKRSTQGDNSRLGIREVELAVQSVVDPYFRGDIFLGISDAEGISVEQAFLTTTGLPNGLQSQLGRFLTPFGKQNTTHRHDLHTVEYPYVLQRFLSDDGLKSTGASLSRVFAPFGFYQEVIVTVADRFGDKVDSLVLTEPVNRGLDGLGFSARLRNYWDLSQNANIELSASAITGKRDQPLGTAYLTTDNVTASGVAARQSVVGMDFTYRWKPLQQGLYSSFILQMEWMQQVNERAPALPDAAPTPAAPPVVRTYAGPTRNYSGGYAFARWQLSRRLYVGGRYDTVQDPQAGGAALTAGSAVLEWFPSEFSKLVASYERLNQPGMTGVNRLLLQATFAVGPHRPHPF
jgi:hypothetical protein